MSSEGCAAHVVGNYSPLQIVMAVWRTFFKILTYWVGCWSLLEITMAVWRASN
jgi:hypothetical protein